MQDDVEMMEGYVSKYGKVGMTSVLHLKEAIVFLTEKPEILQQAVFVDILKRHEGKVWITQTGSKWFYIKNSCWSEQYAIITKTLRRRPTLVCGS